MQEILIQAGCYVTIIVLGYTLRRIGLLPKETFRVLSKIVLNITLPGAVIANSAGRSIDISMLTISLLGLGGGLLYMLLAGVLFRRGGKENQTFAVLNVAGYNIGNFAMPFTQGFLGPTGAVTTSLFDMGNSFICLGGAYGIASVVKDGKGFSLKKILSAPLRSVPFLVYVTVTLLNLLRLRLPGPVISLAEIIGRANAFLGMLMVGAGFSLAGDRTQIGKILRILGLRFGTSALLALAYYYLLPFSLEVRQTLVILLFSPIGSAIPAYTAELKGDTGLASAINSISIICSIVIMVTLLTVLL